MDKKIKSAGKNGKDEKKVFGNPEYSSDEDIYSKAEKESLKEEGEDLSAENDLDVPGSELDDKDEKIGEEDEENNYYSLGGDDHNNLEEDE